ncbi:MAG: endonuclease/exonuclease/phosphatase family protein [Halomonas sp.]|nr:endonuclease/exonuclease/phosphatase family protein [Halomonas sp.]
MLGLLLGSIAIVLLLATLIARIRLRWWWIRSCEFPRLQIASLAIACFIAALFVPASPGWQMFTLVVCLAVIVIQACYILPWTRLWPKQVRSVNVRNQDRDITLLVANVLTPNRQSAGLIEQIQAHQPDIILTLESDHWWQDQLDPALDAQWPYSVKIPLDNLYGMHLYSRLPLENTSVEWLIQDDIPSIHTHVRLPGGESIRLFAVHPRPPAPGESEKSLWRDAELLWVGKKIQQKPEPTLVAGDLNDVAWSRTTRRFCRVGGMLDPRRGRGMFSTFHAHYPILRWPLDHIFVSEHFTLGNMHRLKGFGSDHFPILATLCYRPDRKDEHEIPEASAEEENEASQTIRQGQREEQQT